MVKSAISIDVAGGVGTITLNRPERLNAFDAEMLHELLAATRALVEDDAVRAIVLTGSGRGFCAGADLDRLGEPSGAIDEDAAMELVRIGSEVVQLLHRAPKPVLASLNGPAAGGGVGLALACDLRIASESASLGLVFHRLGLHPDFGTQLVRPATGRERGGAGTALDAPHAPGGPLPGTRAGRTGWYETSNCSTRRRRGPPGWRRCRRSRRGWPSGRCASRSRRRSPSR